MPDPEETEREALAATIREVARGGQYQMPGDTLPYESWSREIAKAVIAAGFRRLSESDSRARLEQVWSALGCAPNLDAFKPAVQQAMWDDALSMITNATARDSRVYRENQELAAEVERLRLSESEIRREAWDEGYMAVPAEPEDREFFVEDAPNPYREEDDRG